MRFSANFTYSGFNSIPIPDLPSFPATSIVVPAPANGSKTIAGTGFIGSHSHDCTQEYLYLRPIDARSSRSRVIQSPTRIILPHHPKAPHAQSRSRFANPQAVSCGWPCHSPLDSWIPWYNRMISFLALFSHDEDHGFTHSTARSCFTSHMPY